MNYLRKFKSLSTRLLEPLIRPEAARLRRELRRLNILLPPANIRYCGTAFKDDVRFVASAEVEARRLIDQLNVGMSSSVLEIGCGPGRLPIGILKCIGEIRRFDGVDVDPVSVAWCDDYISRHHPTFSFHMIDARHERYNPDGRPMDEGLQLSFPDAAFDLIYSHSVFASLVEADVRAYAGEFRRLLRPGGRIFLTAFVEENVPPVTVNPEDYIMPCRGPQHIVRWEKSHLLSFFTRCDLMISRFEHGVELDQQSGIYLRGPG